MADHDQFEIRDGSRIITFEGNLIATVSSRDRFNKPRWSEFHLYKTTGGTYVLEKIGRSIVVHMPACPEIVEQLDRFQNQHPGEDPSVGWWFCETCSTKEHDMTALLIERDRHWVTTSDDPNNIIDELYRRRGNARHLPRLSIDLLEQASRVDDQIKNAFLVEHLA